MIALKIILAVLGIAFFLFGYFIYFKKKYSLINGFDQALREGRVGEDDARRAGLAELVIGICLLLTALLLILLM